MFEHIEFQGKMWDVIAKVDGRRVDDPSTLRNNYMCDMVIKSNQNVFLMLNEIIDVEYEDV